MTSNKVCVIIPVYNNVNTIGTVIDESKNYLNDIIVIDDGSTDGTTEIIKSKNVTSHHFAKNQGKGAALREGLKLAQKMGFTHAITIDADGQHFPKDIPKFIDTLKNNDNSIIVGRRTFNENVGRGSRIGKFFSDFFFIVATYKKPVDTQCGFRLYPLNSVCSLSLKSNAYELEIEILVKAFWEGVAIDEIPISVHYDEPEQRISHFQVGRDGFKASVLYTKLCFAAILYKLPRKAFKSLFKAKTT